MKKFWNGDKIMAKVKASESTAANEVGFFVVGEVQVRCPVKYGNLVGSYKHKVVKNSMVRIGSPVSYAPDVEFGTSAHVIKVKTARILTDGKTFFGKSVHHPGTKAQPHLRPAIYENEGKIRKLYALSYKKAMGL